jgi:Agrobacterium tumefaciens protein Atu4866
MITELPTKVSRRTCFMVLPVLLTPGRADAQDLRTIQQGMDIRPQSRRDFEKRHATQAPHDFLGMWITADGNIRHQLLEGGRYDEARGTRESAYRGRYVISGNFIDYLDDTGFIADGEFKSETLYHYGMILHRRR